MEATNDRLDGYGELTLLMPVKSGDISTLVTETYSSRLHSLLTTFNKLKLISNEAVLSKPIFDVVDRIGPIQALRISVVDNDSKLLLTVSCNESQRRTTQILWHGLGPMLNPILCHCEGYPGAQKDNFSAFEQWLNRHRTERRFDSSNRSALPSDVVFVRDQARGIGDAKKESRTPLLLLAPEIARNNTVLTVRTGLGAIAAIHRITNLFPEKNERTWLLEATHSLMLEFDEIFPYAKLQIQPKILQRFHDPITWYEPPLDPTTAAQTASASIPSAARRELQGGILHDYENINDGALVLMSITSVSEARSFLSKLPLRYADDESIGKSPYINVAFTANGLQRLGMDESEIAVLPQEFLEGMASRATILGDLRASHPTNWILPQCNWPRDVGHIPPYVPLSNVELVVQLRSSEPSPGDTLSWLDVPEHELRRQLDEFDRVSGVKILAVQPMSNLRDECGRIRGHFELPDATSGSAVNNVAKRLEHTPCSADEVALGYAKDSQDGADAALHKLWPNCTFMVVRKLRQDVGCFDELIHSRRRASSEVDTMSDDTQQRRLAQADTTHVSKVRKLPSTKEFGVVANMDDGARALESTADSGGVRVPRLIRRAMSYGSPYRRGEQPSTERGLIFVAYNASIADQFEVIQRKIAGRHTHRSSSQAYDPLLAVAPIHKDPTAESVRPLVRLEWGAYLFVPSRSVVARLTQQKIPETRDEVAAAVARGEELINTLLKAIPEAGSGETASDLWRAFLDDTRSATYASAIWAAVRAKHKGVLRTPYGVLVGTTEAIEEISNADSIGPNRGYVEQMKKASSEIYLGLDSDDSYAKLADIANMARQRISEIEGFDAGFASTKRFFAHVRRPNGKSSTVTMAQLSDWVLDDVSTLWLDIPGELRKEFCAAGHTSRDLLAIVENFAIEKRDDRNSLKGPLSQAIFDAIPRDNNLLARALMNAMMAFLPQVDSHFRACVYSMIGDGTLRQLQQDFLANSTVSAYARAKTLLHHPLLMTIKKRAVTGGIRRTAKSSTTLGGIEIQRGEKVVLGVANAAQAASRATGTFGYVPIVSGLRPSDNSNGAADDQPISPMAMGALLGMLAGLMDAGTLSDTGVPLTLKVQP